MIHQYLARLRSSTLARNTFWMLMGQGLKLVIQAAYFVIIARSLGAQQYGAFIAVTAFTQIVAPLVGLGCGNLMIKNVARDRSLFSESWGNALLMTTSTGVVFIIVLMAVARFVIPATIPDSVVLSVAVADLFFSKLVDCSCWAFQAFEKLRVTAALQIVSSSARLIGISVIAVVLTHPTACEWATAYLATTVLGALVGVTWVHLRFGRPSLALARVRHEFREGLYFCGSLCAQTVYNDIDKTMLARFSTLDAAGIYGAAYRLIDVAFIPVRSLLGAAYPGFFRAGQQGLNGTIQYMKRLLPRPLAYAAVAASVIVICAPVAPHIVGAEYARTVEALRWLALLPVLKTVHYFLADALTGAGYQGLRTLMQALVAVFNVLINLWIIPAHGWRGAAWASLASDGLLCIVLGSVLTVLVGDRRSTGCSAVTELSCRDL